MIYNTQAIELFRKAINDTFTQVHYSHLHPDVTVPIEQQQWCNKWISENLGQPPDAETIIYPAKVAILTENRCGAINIELYDTLNSVAPALSTIMENVTITVNHKAGIVQIFGNELVYRLLMYGAFLEDLKGEIEPHGNVRGVVLKYRTIKDFFTGNKRPYKSAGWYRLKKSKFKTITANNWVIIDNRE